MYKENNALTLLNQDIEVLKSTFTARRDQNLTIEEDIYISASINIIDEINKIIESKQGLL